MTDEERAARRAEIEAELAALRAELAKYEEILRILTDALEKISEQATTLRVEVLGELKEYDVTDGGAAWRGETATDAKDKTDEIVTGMSAYESEVQTLIGEINAAIEKVQKKIEELEEKIKALEDELASL